MISEVLFLYRKATRAILVIIMIRPPRYNYEIESEMVCSDFCLNVSSAALRDCCIMIYKIECNFHHIATSV